MLDIRSLNVYNLGFKLISFNSEIKVVKWALVPGGWLGQPLIFYNFFAFIHG